MSNPTYTNRPSETRESDALVELALNLRWSWNHSADELWGRLEPELWELTQNPWVVLQTVSQERLQSAWADPAFRKRVDELLQEKREAEQSARWFQKTYPDSPLKLVAYFSMEFMLSEALPIYSGGLGNVAGDQLKAASDLGVPSSESACSTSRATSARRSIRDGAQQALYPFNDPGQLPIDPVREPNGEWLRLQVPLPGFTVWLRAWQVQVGRVRCSTCSTPTTRPIRRPIAASPANSTAAGRSCASGRSSCSASADGACCGPSARSPRSAISTKGTRRSRCWSGRDSYMEDNGQPFDVALAVTRAGNIFSPPTPRCDAGFDRFAPELMRTVPGHTTPKSGSASRFQRLLALGRRNPNDTAEPFNMAYLAMRGSGAVNGVSRLHGQVSRRIFQVALSAVAGRSRSRWRHVTNGVHVADLGLGRGRRPVDRGLRRGALARARCENIVAVSPQSGTLTVVGASQPAARQTLSSTRASVWRASWRLQGGSPEEIAEPARVFDSNTFDAGFRAAVRHVQAAESASARSRKAARDPHEPRAPGPVDSRRQGAPGRTGPARP